MKKGRWWRRPPDLQVLLNPHCYFCSTVPRRALNGTTRKKGFWLDINNQREFFNKLGQTLGLKELSDWYGVSRAEVQIRGGKGLLYHYSSLGEALKAVYPEHNWDLSRFNSKKTSPIASKPSGFWADKHNLLEALTKAEQRLGITKEEDWYSVALTDLRELGLPSSITRKQLADLLAKKYPNHSWERVYLLRGRYAQQKRLEKIVSSLFQGYEIITNARKEADLVNPLTGAYLELDIFIPSLNLAFEYQDIHHYKSEGGYGYQPLSVYANRDAIKKKLAEQKGITLIVIPCWWDGKEDSLLATVKEKRPDLLSEKSTTAKPIPMDMPTEYLEQIQSRVKHVEGIGEPTTAAFMTGSEIDPTNWWLFEKYDGVRAFWNPSKKRFYSRHGKELSLPQNIIEAMPSDTFLDGELWFGREAFQEAIKISSKADPSTINWEKFKYMVFDMPNHSGTYAQRYASLETLGGTKAEFIEIAPKTICTGIEHLEKCFQDIIDQGGEGIILRDPVALLEKGRSHSFLKHKKFRDAEAKVVRTVGPNQWECILPNGVTFLASAGSTEFLKRWKPKEGDIVSFKHRGFMAGSKKPKYPTLYRMRPDLTWDTVVNNFSEKKPLLTTLPLLRTARTKKKLPHGYWRNVKHWTEFFTEFAKQNGFDPLDVEKWRKVTTQQIKTQPGGASLVLIGWKRALKKAFPEQHFIFDNSKEPQTKNYWKNPQHCREFFIDYAAEKGFDPLKAESWHNISLEELLSKQGGYSIQEQYGGFKKALVQAFPELHFKEEWHRDRNFWKDATVCRAFFDEYAKEEGFNALDVNNWNSIKLGQLLSRKLWLTWLQQREEERYKGKTEDLVRRYNWLILNYTLQKIQYSKDKGWM